MNPSDFNAVLNAIPASASASHLWSAPVAALSSLHAWSISFAFVLLVAVSTAQQAVNPSIALSAGLSSSARKQLAWWLGGCSAWVFSMVVLGGVTRLTRSGLSMTDWKFTGGCRGQEVFSSVCFFSARGGGVAESCVLHSFLVSRFSVVGNRSHGQNLRGKGICTQHCTTHQHSSVLLQALCEPL